MFRIGDRRLREDRSAVKCPLALSWIVDRIIFHTQPSPCKVKTNHDHAAGNHTRSEKDNSLVCVYPDKCPTESVRYFDGDEASAVSYRDERPEASGELKQNSTRNSTRYLGMKWMRSTELLQLSCHGSIV